MIYKLQQGSVIWSLYFGGGEIFYQYIKIFAKLDEVSGGEIFYQYLKIFAKLDEVRIK